MFGYNASAGHYYEAKSTFDLVAEYLESQVISGCGLYCGYYYDPYNYTFIGTSSEGATIPTFNTTVWAAPIIITAAVVKRILALGTNGTSYTVPGNRGVFNLKLRAFIPAAWFKGPDPCFVGSTLVSGTIYAGDNRTYDPFSTSYRARSEATISASTGSTIGAPILDGGVTRRYASDAVAPDGYTLREDGALHDCHYTDNVFLESNSDMHLSLSGGSGIIHANFWGSAKDEASDLGSATPGTDWNVTYTINAASNPVTPGYTIEYTHECYPAYEAYIGTQRVYGYKQNSNSAITLASCLSGVGQVVGSQ